MPENSRSILVASVEHQEGVRLPKEILLVQLVGTELHCGDILVGRREKRGVRHRRLEGGPAPMGTQPQGLGILGPKPVRKDSSSHCPAPRARP